MVHGEWKMFDEDRAHTDGQRMGRFESGIQWYYQGHYQSVFHSHLAVGMSSIWIGLKLLRSRRYRSKIAGPSTGSEANYCQQRVSFWSLTPFLVLGKGKT